jgi:hypothetical protein
MRSTISRLSSPRVWFHGLASAFIGGAASAILADQGVTIMHRFGVKVDVLSANQLLSFCISGGITTAAAYLKKSPLPPIQPIATDETTDP